MENKRTLRERLSKLMNPWVVGIVVSVLVAVIIVDSAQIRGLEKVQNILSDKVDELTTERNELRSENAELESSKEDLSKLVVTLRRANSVLRGVDPDAEANLDADNDAESGDTAGSKTTDINANRARVLNLIASGFPETRVHTPDYATQSAWWDQLTEEYNYNRLRGVPEVLPEDCYTLTFDITENCTRGHGETTLAKFTHPTLNAEITVTIPEVKDLTYAVRGVYSMVAVAMENKTFETLRVEYFVFNPADDNTITMVFSPSSGLASIDMREYVVNLGLYSYNQGENGLWVSDGSHVEDWGNWGSTEGGDHDFVFDAYTVKLSNDARAMNSIVEAIEMLPRYLTKA